MEKMFLGLKDEIVCVVTPNGDIIGKLLELDESYVKVGDPRGFIQTQEGVGFAPSVSMGCAHEPSEVVINGTMIITITKSHEEIVKAWRQQTSGLVTP